MRDGDVNVVVRCHAGCKQEQVIAALRERGLWADAPRQRVPRARSGGSPAPDPSFVTNYQIKRPDGELVALHRRHDFADGSKSLTWLRPHGEPGLDGLAAADLPLYRSESLPSLPAQAPVVVVEGEKAADALAHRLDGATVGVLATAGGAAVTPSDAVLTSLAHRRVVLWPDADEPGRKHMDQVAAGLQRVGAAEVKFATWPDAPEHGDAANYVAQHNRAELLELPTAARAEGVQFPGIRPLGRPDSRVVVLSQATEIRPRSVKWLYQDHIPLGALTILGVREGVGKTLYWAEIAAKVTRGDLPGIYSRQPHGVIVAATEDSWAMTIVPRLMAAGADLARVFRVNATTSESVDSALSLPDDLPELEWQAGRLQIALVVLDPLLSRLSSRLDTHRDAEVRLALEPLVALADRCGVSVAGLIHVNKSGSVDALTGLMGSRAFAAVARAVIYMTLDPDDSEVRLVGVPKNNLGRSDLPIQSCRIEEVVVADTEEGPIRTARLVWTGTRTESIANILEASAETSETRSATAEAKRWLSDYLRSKGGLALRKDILAASKRDGHSEPSLRRAREALGLRQENVEGVFPRQTNWTLRSRVESPSTHTTGMTSTTGTTSPPLNTATHSSPASGASRDSRVDSPPARASAKSLAEPGWDLIPWEALMTGRDA
ncbi:MAG: AAA family ATPase [Candidatus Dormibacteria bacterium]